MLKLHNGVGGVAALYRVRFRLSLTSFFDVCAFTLLSWSNFYLPKFYNILSTTPSGKRSPQLSLLEHEFKWTDKKIHYKSLSKRTAIKCKNQPHLYSFGHPISLQHLFLLINLSEDRQEIWNRIGLKFTVKTYFKMGLLLALSKIFLIMFYFDVLSFRILIQSG